MRVTLGVGGLFWLALAAATLLLLFASPARGTSAVTFKAAGFCCPGCSYYNSGAPRDRIPVTIKKYRKTKTTTVLKTVTASRKAAVRRNAAVNVELPSVEEPELDEVSEITLGSGHLFARHLCPRCPSGVKVLKATSGKTNSGGSYSYCCPARKTVTKTLARTTTKTITRTRTTTAVPKVRYFGRVYYDINKNGVFDQGIDNPIANTVIYIVITAPPKRLIVREGHVILGSGKTNGTGHFGIDVPIQQAGTQMGVVKDVVTYEPLLEFTASGSNTSTTINAPVPRPVLPVYTAPPEVDQNVVTVHGTGVPGFFVNLYANGVRVGSVQVAADGTFAVTSSALKNGLFKLQIAHMISTGAESDLVSADSVTIAVNTTIDPPTAQLPATSTSDNKASISGTGSPGAVINLYADGQLVGSSVVGPDGKYTVISTSALAPGTYDLTVTQTVSGTESVHASGGTLVILPAAPTLNLPATIAGSAATITGTGVPGATITLYSDGVGVGTATVGQDGTFSVTSSALSNGSHVLEVSQTVDGAQSSKASGGTVQIGGGATNQPSATNQPGGATTTANNNGGATTGGSGGQTTAAAVTTSTWETTSSFSATATETTSSFTETTSSATETSSSYTETSSSYTETSSSYTETSSSETETTSTFTPTTTATYTKSSTTAPPRYLATMRSNTGNERIYDFQEDKQGEKTFIACGIFNDAAFFGRVRGDLSGIWSLNGGSTGDMCTAVLVDATTKDVYAIGLFSSSSLTLGTATFSNIGSAGSTDIWLMKTDKDGIVQWSKTIGSTGSEQGVYMARDSSGNVIVVALGGGSIDLGNSITLSASSKLIYAKINPSTGVASSGVLLSSSTFDGSCGFALYANDTGVGCAVASSSVTLGSTTLSPTNPDVAIFQFSSAGTPLFAFLMGSGAQDGGAVYPANSISIDSSGYIMTSIQCNGTTFFADQIGGGSASYSTTRTAPNSLICKYSSGGARQWCTPLTNGAYWGTAMAANGKVNIAGSQTNVLYYYYGSESLATQSAWTNSAPKPHEGVQMVLMYATGDFWSDWNMGYEVTNKTMEAGALAQRPVSMTRRTGGGYYIFGYYKSRQFKWNGNDYYQVGSLTEDGFVYAFDDTLGYALINP